MINKSPNIINYVSYKELGSLSNGVLTIKDTIDLHGKECRLPAGLSLCFDGGYLSNGTLVGDMTRLDCDGPCFYHISIQGSWNAPVINSTMFDDLSYENALRDVIALSHPSIKNKILINKGEYYVATLHNNESCLSINSNTELVLDGTIRIKPSSFNCYNIIKLTGDDIIVRGSGAVIGDRSTHIGTDGEWGMGINVNNAHNTIVSGLMVKDCWGDCIYVGDRSTNITIEKCNLDNSRRQGISVTSANGVIIKDCVITNISGTAPEYAIDLEPNKDEFVGDIIIDGVISSNCGGGVAAACYASNSRIGSVTVRNCTITANNQYAIKFVKCEKALAEMNDLTLAQKRYIVICKEVGDLVVERNKLCYKRGVIRGVNSIFNRVVLGKASDLIRVIDCDKPIVRNNTEYRN